MVRAKARFVLVQLRHATAPETGQRYTHQAVREWKGRHGRLLRREGIIFKPVNTDFASIVFTGAEEGELQVIAELVEVLRADS
jgi:hypothetical protein